MARYKRVKRIYARIQCFFYGHAPVPNALRCTYCTKKLEE